MDGAVVAGNAEQSRVGREVDAVHRRRLMMMNMIKMKIGFNGGDDDGDFYDEG